MEIVHLCLPRPGTHLPNVPMTHMHPTPEPHAFGVQSGAMKAPMPNFVTEPTKLPCGALFVAVIGTICSALTAVIPGELHLQVGLSLFGIGTHCYLVQHGPLYYTQGFGTTCTALLTNLRTEFPET
jgi:hypothetical protein